MTPEEVELSGGSLGIVERRSWATWQLAAVALVAVVVGMMIGYSGKKPAKASSVDANTKPLPGLIGSSASAATPTTTSSGLRPGVQQLAPTTSLATANTRTTSVANASAACNAPRADLVPNTQGSGPSQLPSFTATGAWCLGWAYSCVLAPGGTGPFTLTAVGANGESTGTPAVQQSSRSGNGETPLSLVGTYHVQVTTDPACRWAVHVTGT